MKGMIRSYAEKICRSLRDEPVPVCLPYVEPGKEQDGEKRQASCGLRFEIFKKGKGKDIIPSSEIYRYSCPACRVFGSHGFTGRFAASDAYLTEKFKATGSPVLEIRDGVAIDRITGGAASGAKYDLEVLTRGEFGATLEIRNFERWQLGLLSLVLRDMEQGLVRIGFGKSRGLGRFEARISRFQLTYYHRKVRHLRGLSSLCSNEDKIRYGFFEETGDEGPALPAPAINGLRLEYNLTDGWKDILAPAVDDLAAFIEKTDWPQNLEAFIKGGR